MFELIPYNKKTNGLARRGDIFDVVNIFEDFFSDPFFTGNFRMEVGIRADIRENEKEYIVEAEIPGVRKEDIKLDLRDDVLTVSVDKNEEIKEEKDNYIRRERRHGSFKRCFHVNNIKNEGVEAKYNDGILTVKLPKDEKSRNSHNIEIH